MSGEQDNLVPSLLQWGDDALILGQRLAEWCGHGPILEEDIALTNISLDLIGQARNWLTEAGKRMAEEKSEDDLAYFRTERAFRNHKILELPNGHFGDTICRLHLWSEFSLLRLEALLQQTVDPEVQAVAAKSIKEVKYHVAHAREWMIRLGDGTQESHDRLTEGLKRWMPYTGEFFVVAMADQPALDAGILPDPASFEDLWREAVGQTLEKATLAWPAGSTPYRGGKDGFHTEHLGYVLAEMQSLARTYPGVEW